MRTGSRGEIFAIVGDLRSKLIVKVLKTKLDIAFFSKFFILLFQYYDKALLHVKLRKSFFET